MIRNENEKKKKNEKNKKIVPYFGSGNEFFPDWPSVSRMDRYLNDLLATSFGSFPTTMKYFHPSFPHVDIMNLGDSFRIRVDLPGIEKDKIKLNVSDDIVEINAKNTEEKEEERKDYYKKERSTYGYYRILSMPDKLDPSTVKATYKDGVLQIDVRKSKINKKEIKIE